MFWLSPPVSWRGLRRLRAASFFPSDGKETNGPGHPLLPLRGNSPRGSPGDAADGHFVPIGPPPYPLCRFATSPPDRGSRPPDPHYGGYPLEQAESFRRAKSEWVSEFPPGHFVVADFVSLASPGPGKARSLHRSSSPTQTRFAGLCVGGRLRRPVGRKISNGAVPQLRLGGPNQRPRVGFRRRGGCPHPPASKCSDWRVGAATWGRPSPAFPPQGGRTIPPIRGKCPEGTKGVGGPEGPDEGAVIRRG